MEEKLNQPFTIIYTKDLLELKSEAIRYKYKAAKNRKTAGIFILTTFALYALIAVREKNLKNSTKGD